MLSLFEIQAFQKAVAEAARFVGATAPNPPVGAAVLDSRGELLALRAHERAGTAHAEAAALAELRSRGLLEQAHTLLATLEPCQHTGRTPPCADAILAVPGIRRVIYGSRDPNPAAGGGAARLAQAGLEVVPVTEPALAEASAELIRPFSHWIRTGRPWVTVKTAHLEDGSMIPPAGQKTFTSESSLTFAHELRRRADALITGSGTVLADDPEFTVRRVTDYPGKSRWLVVLDRRGRVPESWLKQAETRGFRVLQEPDLKAALRKLGALGCLEALVEAGPTLSQAILSSPECLWDSHVVITRGNPDRIETQLRQKPSVYRHH